jgi:hypothetical protein
MLALGIALVVIALISPLTVTTLVVWLFGIGVLGYCAGRGIAAPVKKTEVSKDENRH